MPQKNPKNISFLEKLAANKHLFWILPIVFILVLSPLAPARAGYFDDWCWSPSGCIDLILATVLGWMGSWVAAAAKLLNIALNLPAVNDAGNVTVVQNSWAIIRDFANMFFIVILIVMAFATIFDISEYDSRKLLPKFIIAAVLINFSLVIGMLIIRISQTVASTFINAIGDISSQLGQYLVKGMPGITSSNSASLSALKTVTATVDTTAITAISVVVLLAILIVCFISVTIFALIRIPVLWFLLILSPIAWITGILPSTRHINQKWWKHFMAWNLFLPIYLFFLYFGIYFLSKSGATISALAGQYATSQTDLFSLTFETIFNYVLVGIFMLGGLAMTMSMSFFSGTGVVKVAGWSKNAAIGALTLGQAGNIKRAAEERRKQFQKEGFQNKYLNKVYGGTEGTARMQAGIASSFGVRDVADKQLAKDIDIYKDRFRNQTEDQLRADMNKGPKYEQLARRELLNQRGALKGDEALDTYKMYGEDSTRSREFMRGLDMKKFTPAERGDFYKAIASGDSLSRQKVVNAMVESGDIQDAEKLIEMSAVFTDENQRLEYFKKAKETLKNYRPQQRRDILESKNPLITNAIKANVAEIMNEEKELNDVAEIRNVVKIMGEAKESKDANGNYTQQFYNRLNKFLDNTKKYDVIEAAKIRVEYGLGVSEVEDPNTGIKRTLDLHNPADRALSLQKTTDKEFGKLEDKEVIGQRQIKSPEYQDVVARNITSGRVESIVSRSTANKAQLKALDPAFKIAIKSENIKNVNTKKVPSLRKDIESLTAITSIIEKAKNDKNPDLANIRKLNSDKAKSIISSARRTVSEINKLELPDTKEAVKQKTGNALDTVVRAFNSAAEIDFKGENLKQVQDELIPGLRKAIDSIQAITKTIEDAKTNKDPNLVNIKKFNSDKGKSVIANARKIVNEINKLDLPETKDAVKQKSGNALDAAIQAFTTAIEEPPPSPKSNIILTPGAQFELDKEKGEK